MKTKDSINIKVNILHLDTKIENATKSDNTEEFSSQTVATLPTTIKMTMVVTSLITTTNKTRWIMLIG